MTSLYVCKHVHVHAHVLVIYTYLYMYIYMHFIHIFYIVYMYANLGTHTNEYILLNYISQYRVDSLINICSSGLNGNIYRYIYMQHVVHLHVHVRLQVTINQFTFISC